MIVNEFVQAERTKDAVIEALNEKDREKLKAIFSPAALEEAKQYESGEDYLFSLFEGKCEMCEETSQSSKGHMGNPGRLVSVSTYYLVKFGEDEFKLYLYEFPINKQNRRKKGLYSLALLPIEEVEVNKEYNAKLAGIYYPGWTN